MENINNPATKSKKPNTKPVIRQTLTSMYRMIKANPLLLKNQNEIVNDMNLSNMKIPKAVLRPASQYSLLLNSTQDISNTTLKCSTSKESLKKVEKTATKNIVNLPKIINNSTKPTQVKKVINKTQPSKVPDQPKRKLNDTISSEVKKFSTIKPIIITNKKQVVIKRKSLSADRIELKKNTGAFENYQQRPKVTTTEVKPQITNRRVVFKTPLANKRRSVSFTNSISHNKKSSIPMQLTPRIVSTDLQGRLNNWLHKHNKPQNSYKNLKSLTIPKITIEYDEENKENIEISDGLNCSYENLNIIPSNGKENCTQISSDDLFDNNRQETSRSVAISALKDLQNLIDEAYSQEQCQAWLELIHEKYIDLEDEPQFWECKASIEQSRGNITSAVQCLHTAIVQGAEITSVDHSLEQLLQKFSLLNINDVDQYQVDNIKKTRAKIICDARNIFKSSIIQFAIHERTLKKEKLEENSKKRFIATPVRRSTRRLTQTTSTPGTKVYPSLKCLDKAVLDNLTFEKNLALL